MERPRFVDSYGLLFLLLLGIMVLLAIAGDSDWGSAVLLIAMSTATWLALRASHVQRTVLRLAVATIPIVTVIALLLLVAGSERTTDILSGALLLLLVIAAPLAIVKNLANRADVTANTFFAAVSVYLLVAMFFATLYSLIALITREPFFVQTDDPSAVEYLYFSFTTITTVGYGDYTAALSLGKMMAMIEAVLGQLYLITVVALVVQNLGQARQERLREREEEES